ncbi:MAG TPA: FG-GAP-like repeat-containing protein [Bacteroidales bacterium]|nr:FG-GAP-like repeat-containing protein [Bacteroidales bacterium]
MKRIIILSILLFPFLTARPQTPTILWHFDVNAPSYGQAAMGDIDGDGKPEIVFSTYMNDGNCYALNAEDGSLLWKFPTGDCNDAAPIICDVDGDGLPEVILASSCVPVTYCLEGATGHIKWQTPTGGTDSPPSIGDVDNDGKPEILHGEFNGSVICINGEDGSIAWEKLIDPDASIQTSPALLDVDGDGQLDFVVANWSYTNTNRIWAFRGDNQQQIWVSDLPTDVIYHGGAFADIDGDGKPELVFGCYDDHVYALNAEDGSEKWSFDMGAYNYVGGPTPLADVDNDGNYEVLAAGWYKMKAIRSDGTEKWNYDIPDYASCFRGPVLSDIDGDGYLDVVFGTSEGKVIALHGNTGAWMWTLDLAADYGDTLDIDHAPVIGDFNGDGLLEGFVVGGFTNYPNIANDYGRAYAFTLGSGTRPEWRMFQHDTARSSCVPLDWETGIPSREVQELKITAMPDPFSTDLMIGLSKPYSGTCRLELISSDGRIVKTLENVNIPGGGKYTWSSAGVGLHPGLYLLKITLTTQTACLCVVRD